MATSKVVVAGSSVSASQLKDLFRQFEDDSLNGHHLQAFLEHRDPFKIAIDTQSQLERWQAILTQDFGLELDLASLVIPERQPGFDRLIVVPAGLTLNRLVETLRQKFNVWLYTENLNETVTVNDRVNSESYAIWVRNEVEADEELKNLSADDCQAKEIKGEMLMERLLHEAVYYSETSQHLDMQSVTLCTGSRFSGGGVPHVDWDAGYRRLQVDWCYSGVRDDRLRARAVVS